MDQHVLQGTNMDQPQTNIQLQGILIIFINNLSPVLPLPWSPSPPLPSLPITLQAPHNRGRGEGGPSGFGLTEKYPYFYASSPFQWSVLIRCNLADSFSPKLAKSLQTDHTFKRIHYTDLHFLGNKRIIMKMSGKGSMLLNSNYWFWETTMFCDIHWQI